MIRSYTVFLFILTSTVLHSQDFEWITTAGGLLSDKGTTIAVDGDGNTFITGYYNEQADFGPLNTGFSFDHSKEVFVAKMDPNGTYLWVVNGLNYYDDRGLGLCLDPTGNVYVTGTCWGGLTFGPLNVYNSTSYTDQIFVTKIDTGGNVIWMKNAGVDENFGFPYNDDHGLDLAADSQGNIYVTGFLSNAGFASTPATFDGIVIDMAAEDTLAFVAKLSNDGIWQWVQTFQGIVDHRDNGIGVDDEDNVYVTGGFVGTKDFGGTNLVSDGETDIYVVKYDPAGTFQWAAQAGSTLKDRGNAIVDGHDGFMYVAGEFRDHCYFGPQLLNNYGGPNGRDIFVAKLSKNGVWGWASKAGSKKGSDRANSIAANTSGNIFVTGQYSSEAKFGIHEIDSNGDSVQVFIAAIDTLGVWHWVKQGGASQVDRGNGITVDDDCNIYVIGYFEDTITFEALQQTPNQGKDIFTTKLSDACFGYNDPPPPAPGEEYCALEVANVFTPNGDGMNEEVLFTTACNVPIEAYIMNRWGEVVFTTFDSSVGWDGTTANGKLVSEGTYFYSVKAIFEFEPVQEIHGWITVVR
ncbi:MAG: SBBP repeat-containing protein [Crocinitomicaceae bacterium]|nr:SBBP repeat-containing protein [Crocinitomicaceae bacterium]